MQTLYESKCGERGIFSRVAAKKLAERNGRRDAAHNFGTNPCSEIILRSNQFCNLSEVVVREDDDLTSLKRKVKLATILGTLQSTLTDFRYLRVRWKRNTEEESLLGVSLTGIMDHYLLSKPTTDLEKWLGEMKDVAIETNRKWSERLGVNESTAITCVKPSGTVSQLVNSASGIHLVLPIIIFVEFAVTRKILFLCLCLIVVFLWSKMLCLPQPLSSPFL